MRGEAMAEAKLALKRDVGAIVRELVPHGARRGRIWSAKNPNRADAHAGSFVVWLQGAGAGAWKDYATGETGDIIDLVAFAKGVDRAGALAWAQDRCGLHRLTPEAREQFRQRALRDEARDLEREKTRVEKSRLGAELTFAKADKHLSPIVYSYFASRGIDLAQLVNAEARWFRFLPAAEWWMGRAGDKRGPFFPALLSAFTDDTGKMRALHYTFLAPDGSGKAPVDKPKLIWPSPAACVIRINKGESGLTPEEAAKASIAGPCAITEGVEDGMTLALAAPEMRVWAAGSLGGLLTLRDHACVSSWLVTRDNDWGKPQAAELFDKAVARLKRLGKPVTVIASSRGKDFNDQLRGQV